MNGNALQQFQWHKKTIRLLICVCVYFWLGLMYLNGLKTKNTDEVEI